MQENSMLVLTSENAKKEIAKIDLRLALIKRDESVLLRMKEAFTNYLNESIELDKQIPAPIQKREIKEVKAVKKSTKNKTVKIKSKRKSKGGVVYNQILPILKKYPNGIKAADLIKMVVKENPKVKKKINYNIQVYNALKRADDIVSTGENKQRIYKLA